MTKLIDLTNRIFGFYHVIERAPNNPLRSSPFWRCYCQCGNERIVRGDFLRSGQAKSCGCLKTSVHRLRRIFDKTYLILPNECWEWNGTRDKYGYGNLGDKGHKAHRYSYERYHEPIPKGAKVKHSCHNPWCVNPRHLYLDLQA